MQVQVVVNKDNDLIRSCRALQRPSAPASPTVHSVGCRRGSGEQHGWLRLKLVAGAMVDPINSVDVVFVCGGQWLGMDCGVEIALRSPTPRIKWLFSTATPNDFTPLHPLRLTNGVSSSSANNAQSGVLGAKFPDYDLACQQLPFPVRWQDTDRVGRS